MKTNKYVEKYFFDENFLPIKFCNTGVTFCGIAHPNVKLTSAHSSKTKNKQQPKKIQTAANKKNHSMNEQKKPNGRQKIHSSA